MLVTSIPAAVTTETMAAHLKTVRFVHSLSNLFQHGPFSTHIIERASHTRGNQAVLTLAPLVCAVDDGIVREGGDIERRRGVSPDALASVFAAGADATNTALGLAGTMARLHLVIAKI